MDWDFALLSPGWLALLAVLPVVALLSRRSLSGLGPVRKWVAIGLRCLVLALLILAVADLQIVRTADRLCTLFVLDQSRSIPEAKTPDALDAISKAMAERPDLKDQVGLVVFGKKARVELPPYEYSSDKQVLAVGSMVDPEYSDLAGGIKLALGSFPPDTNRRIVLVSDGNQNRGNVLEQAVAAEQNDVPIDVAPVEYTYNSEILVEKIALPSDLKKGDTANLRIVVNSTRPATGLLRLKRLSDRESTVLVETRQQLKADKNVFTTKIQIDEPSFYKYEAEFIPDADVEDRLAANNKVTGFTWVRGKGKVLLLSNAPQETLAFASALREENIEVDVRQPDQVGQDLQQLQQYDSVILGNVPAEDLGQAFQEQLVSNTQDSGIGLIMLGGPDSFGAGGYIGTPIEKAMPVDMEIKSSKVRGKGALVLIMHACEIPEGNFWQKEIAKLAVKKLGSYDECGLLYWGGTTSWLFRLQPVGNRSRMLGRIGGMTPGDMPDFEPSMRMALNGLLRTSAMTKHVIIISDGDPSAASAGVLQALRDARISCTTVAVNSHGAFSTGEMKRIANATKGRFYEVTNPRNLPQIYTKETRVVSRPLIYEKESAWKPTLAAVTDPVAGLGADLPPISGFVLTTRKPVAECPITSPIPSESELNPILAHWQYGLGKSVAFTSDTGERWAGAWRDSDVYKQFWGQLVRWSMRPAESQDLTVSTREQDGKVTVVVNALDKSSEFMNFLDLDGRVTFPDPNRKASLDFTQTEPGKYVAEFDAEDYGSYMMVVSHRQKDGSLALSSSGFTISYPPEYRDVTSNRGLLEQVASISDGRVVDLADLGTTDFFLRNRPPAQRLQDAWPWLLVLALVAFLFDVAVRRIALEPAQMAYFARKVWAKATFHRPPPAPSETMSRLSSVKREAAADFQTRERRFDLTDAADTAAPPAGAADRPAAARPASPKPTDESLTAPPEATDEDSYAAKLLRAKKKVWEDENRP